MVIAEALVSNSNRRQRVFAAPTWSTHTGSSMAPESFGNMRCQLPSNRLHKPTEFTASSLSPRHKTPRRFTSAGVVKTLCNRSSSVLFPSEPPVVFSSDESIQHRNSISHRVSIKSGALPKLDCLLGTPYL